MHPNERLARREMELIAAGDIDGLRALYADDCVFHYPGKNPLAGEHRGLDAFFARFEAVFGDATVERTLHDASGTDEHAVQILNVEADAGGRTHSWRAIVVYHVRDGGFVEAWIHVDDQYELDAFLNSL